MKGSNKCTVEVIPFIWQIFIKHPLCSWHWTRPWCTQTTKSLLSRDSHNNLCFSANVTFSMKTFLLLPARILCCSHFLISDCVFSFYFSYSTSVHSCSIFSPVFHLRVWHRHTQGMHTLPSPVKSAMPQWESPGAPTAGAGRGGHPAPSALCKSPCFRQLLLQSSHQLQEVRNAWVILQKRHLKFREIYCGWSKARKIS